MSPRVHRFVFGRRGWRVGLLAAVLVLVAWSGSAARASSQIWWSAEDGKKISFFNLDGSGAGDLSTAGATVNEPNGVTIDAAAGRIYWANHSGGKISFANLDGSGGGDLPTTGATVVNPKGIAIDPVGGKIYWSNQSPTNKISFANLNGSGGGDLNTTGATVNSPSGLAVDRADGRLYWANQLANSISYANLNNTGGGVNIAVTGTGTLNRPIGVAVDPVAGKIYWANFVGNKISLANLDGSNSADLTTTPATVNGPQGVAVDLAAGKIYWANAGGDKISVANLNGSGGQDLKTTTSGDFPVLPSLLEAPIAAGAPTISGGSITGSPLTCSQGFWASDLLGQFLYRAPAIAYSWQLDGAAIPGATGPTFTPTVPGRYSCGVTGTNHAGSGGTQTSAQVLISAAPSAPAVAHVTGASESNKKFRVSSNPQLVQIARRRRPPVGTTFKFTLDKPATVRFDFTQPLPGRKVNGKCVAQTKRNKHKRKCTRTAIRGSLSVAGHAGVNTVKFRGWLSRKRKLKPGKYTLVITAITPGVGTTSQKLTFTIVR